MRFVAGVFLVLHGLVHLLYVGQSARVFELQPGMVWPDGSWLTTSLVTTDAVRMIANVTYVIAALGFVGAGVGLMAGMDWWRVVAVTSAAFSTVMVFLLWDGTLQQVQDQGLIAVLLNVAILVAVLGFQWPSLGLDA